MEALEKIKDIIYSYFKNEHCLEFAVMVYYFFSQLSIQDLNTQYPCTVSH